MEKVTLNADERVDLGTQGTKKIRKQDLVPGIVYKKGKNPVHVKFSDREFIHVLHSSAGENAVIELNIKCEGDKTKKKTVIVHQMQHDPVKDSVMHVDFKEISLKEHIEVLVKVEARGEAIGATRDGGVLEHVMWEMPIDCLPTDIPEKIWADVSALEIGSVLHAKDVEMPEGATCKSDPEAVVFACEAPKAAPEPAEEEALEEGESSEPEVLKQKAEGEEGQETEGPAKSE